MRWLVATVCAILAMEAPGGPDPDRLSAKEMAAGRKLAARKCIACHKLYDPVEYDGEKWNHWMEKMKAKAKLNGEQFDQLTRYFNELRDQSASDSSPAAPTRE